MSTNRPQRLQREAKMGWVPVNLMKVFPAAQRSLNQGWVNKLIETCDLERIGTLTVNHRDGTYWILDGQHRVEMLKGIGYGDQQVQCWVYEGMSDDEMAESFLKLNDSLTVSTFSKFRIGVKAGRPEECEIDKIVRSLGLRITQSADTPGAIRAVGTLRRVHRRGVLERTLRIIRDAYGDAGFEADVIDGIGLVCTRYDGQLNDDFAVRQLSALHGNLNGLVNRAGKLREQTMVSPAQCVAAAAVEIINRGNRRNKLDPWFQ